MTTNRLLNAIESAENGLAGKLRQVTTTSGVQRVWKEEVRVEVI
jgi:hypothetical protein